MWYVLRVIFLLKKAPRFALFDKVPFYSRVKLWDLDLNIHLTNSRYLKYLDLGRLEYMVLTGLLGRFIPKKVRPVVANVDITFIRSLMPFEKFTLNTRLSGWDEKYLYFEQEFIGRNGKTCAVATSRLCPLLNGKPLPLSEMMQMVGVKDASPELSASTLQWRDMLQNKRKSN